MISRRHRNMVGAAESATRSAGGTATVSSVPWVASLQASLADGAGDAQRRALREEGLQRFATLGLPTTRQEAWRWFPVGHLNKPAFEAAVAGNGTASPSRHIGLDTLQSLCLCDPGGPRLVFVDGLLAADLSRLSGSGLTLAPLMDAAAAAARSAALGRIAVDAGHAFLALNDAFFQEGAWLRVTREYGDGPPVHLVFVTTQADAPRVSHPRVLLQVDAGAQAQVVQEYVGLATEPCLVNSVTEAQLGEGATLRLTKLKHDSPATTHVALTAVHQERDSNYEGYSFSWNAGHVRNDDQVVLDGEGAHCALHGLIHLQGEQVADDHTQVHHRKPHTTSIEHYRAVLDDRSRGAFNGAIFVAPHAQQINSQQSSRNLLLSDRALMNSKPELQILADDVKCSHGATIGQLDPEALFYLRTRGVDRAEALRILTLAFGRAVVDHVPLDCVRQALTAELFGEEGGDGD